MASLIRGKSKFEDLSLIYVLGLYDYLADAVARRLTGVLFHMLASGGKLVLANYAPDSQGRGYMESFMDWTLAYRDEAGLEACTADISKHASAERRTFRDRYSNIVFTELVRA